MFDNEVFVEESLQDDSAVEVNEPGSTTAVVKGLSSMCGPARL